MDTEIRDALARSLPDLALIVRRDGIVLSCVGGHAVRGLNASEDEIPGRSIMTLWPESMASHVLQTVRRIRNLPLMPENSPANMSIARSVAASATICLRKRRRPLRKH